MTVKNVGYCCIMYNISKSEVLNLLENSVLEDRGYIYKNIVLILVYSRLLSLFFV